MAGELPTVLVVQKESGTEMRINQSDFNPDLHTRVAQDVGEVLATKVPGKAAKASKPLPPPIPTQQPVTPGDEDDEDDDLAPPARKPAAKAK